MPAKPEKNTNRRTFIKNLAGGIVAASSASVLSIAKADDSPSAVSNNTVISDKDAPIREFLKQAVLKRGEILML